MRTVSAREMPRVPQAQRREGCCPSSGASKRREGTRAAVSSRRSASRESASITMAAKRGLPPQPLCATGCGTMTVEAPLVGGAFTTPEPIARSAPVTRRRAERSAGVYRSRADWVHTGVPSAIPSRRSDLGDPWMPVLPFSFVPTTATGHPGVGTTGVAARSAVLRAEAGSTAEPAGGPRATLGAAAVFQARLEAVR